MYEWYADVQTFYDVFSFSFGLLLADRYMGGEMGLFCCDANMNTTQRVRRKRDGMGMNE